MQAKFLLRNGADQVVYPEKQVAKWAAIRYTADHIFDYIEFDEQHAIFEVEVPAGWIGKSVGELDIRRKYGINILGIKHSGKIDAIHYARYGAVRGNNDFSVGRIQSAAKVLPNLNGR